MTSDWLPSGGVLPEKVASAALIVAVEGCSNCPALLASDAVPSPAEAACGW